jgi:hypothetical protein
MDVIRLATVDEVNPIADKLDITPTSTVVTFGGKDFAVHRICRELDQFVFDPETSDKRKLFFLTNLETALRLQGVTEVYFNIPAADTVYRNVIERLGAEPISPEPMIRYKKVL